METWLNKLYSEGATTTIATYTTWLLEYLGSLGGITLIFIMGLLTLMFVIYVKMIRSFIKGLLLTLGIALFAFFAYYFIVFKTDYPTDRMLDAIESSSSQSLLDEKELKRLDVQSVAVSEIQEKLGRSDIAVIGSVDHSQLKKLMFTIRNSETDKLETSTLYGYVSEVPSKDRKDYITYYEVEKENLLPAMQVLPFFQHDMYNITVYKRENNLTTPALKSEPKGSETKEENPANK